MRIDDGNRVDDLHEPMERIPRAPAGHTYSVWHICTLMDFGPW
jgi:hypothetical protein